MKAAQTIVAMTGVSIKIDGKVILHDINYQINAGTVVALVGESGSGKSTFLYTLNGLLVPSSGQITVLGQELPTKNPAALRRRIGLAVQNSALMPHLRVFDNLTIMARLVGWPVSRIQARFVQLMALLELDTAMGECYPHQLSGGQQQRISLGRAFMLGPEMLLLDEPFSALDPITRRSVSDRFEALMAAEKKSAVLVTHNLAEAERLADQLVVLHQGRIVQTGTAEEIIKQPVNDYVARLWVKG